MDKNQTTGLLLILLILIGWSWWTTPTPAEIERRKVIQDSIAQLKLAKEAGPIATTSHGLATNTTAAPAVNDSLQQLKLQGQFGNLSQYATGTESLRTIENDKIKITFSNKGGVIKEVLLKDYDKIITPQGADVEEKTKVKLLEDAKNKFDYGLNIGGRTVQSGDLYFTGSQDANQVKYSIKTDDGAVFDQYYVLNDDYTLEYQIYFDGLEASGKDGKSISLNWVNHLDRIEQNVNFEKIYSTVYFKETKESGTDYCSCRGDDEESVDKEMHWVAHVHQFFNTALIARDQGFSYADFDVKMTEDDDEDMKVIQSQLGIPMANARTPFKMQMYLGPNKYEELRAFDIELEQTIAFGTSIFGTINRHIIRPSFEFLAGFIGSKGLVIVLLIFILKMLLYPLMYKMLHSQAKMQALKPRLAQLTEKFKDDAQKKQVETMKIYREYGVSPFGGCMPMVMQMPIWYALFRFFPASITFRQESFLWANDLSSYDMFFNLPFEIPFMGSHLSLFTILWAVTTVLYTFYNTKHMDMSANPAMKYVQYFMPVMFLGFFNTYASGLTCYMFFSNLFNILQTVITKKLVFDDEKILKELDEQKTQIAKKPKKKGGFQAKLEEAMKAQKEIQAKKQGKKKK